MIEGNIIHFPGREGAVGDTWNEGGRTSSLASKLKEVSDHLQRNAERLQDPELEPLVVGKISENVLRLSEYLALLSQHA